MRHSSSNPRPRVALVAMPWYSVWVPSVQLSVLRQCLSAIADVTSYELYVDYAATISTRLYDPMSGGGEFVEEWVFAQAYFKAEGVDYETEIERFGFPPLGIGAAARELDILKALADTTSDFLIRMRDAYDWGVYDVIGFTLGIAQTSASMALAAAIKRKFPQVRIIFGGSACLESQGEAIMQICPHVDVVVDGEAEGVVEPLVLGLAEGRDISDIPRLLLRTPQGSIVRTKSDTSRFTFPERSVQPNFDEYFERMTRNRILQKAKIMLPFESSRGCWWGQHSQCTFCGLSEDMRYRARPASSILKELDYLHERYGTTQFFATDLIMPIEYYKELLPVLKNSDRNYWLYYELKANVRREHVELMSGLVHVQPGLESLSTRILRIMKKGINAAQNVQFLKWCTEYGVQIFSWHLIVGMPGETQQDLEIMTRNAGWLHHLPPPDFAYFELHRFSPIHRDPAAFGLRDLRPAALYRKVFPVAEDILDKLVYRFEYLSASFEDQRPPWMEAETADAYASNLREAVQRWREAYERGAAFTVEANGERVVLTDTRISSIPTVTELDLHESRLFIFLDGPRELKSVAETFQRAHGESHLSLGGIEGVREVLSKFDERGWVLIEGGLVIALAVSAKPRLSPSLSISETFVGIDS